MPTNGNHGRTAAGPRGTRQNHIGNRGRGRGTTKGGNSTAMVPPTMDAHVGQMELNADLPERFRGTRRPLRSESSPLPESGIDLTLNKEIRKYVNAQNAIQSSGKSDAWLSLSELPTNAEVSIKEGEVEFTANKIKGAWKSKERYLRAHYRLLREDAISPLREAIDAFRDDPEMNDNLEVHIYEKVHIAGLTFAPLGIAVRITFSTSRAGRKIPWESSKRLTSGTAVALSPAKDKFGSKCIVALVAARPLQGVNNTPCEIDIYFNRPEDLEIDPQEEWLMLEANTGYFEAYRHTLRAIQKLHIESFPLSDEICSLSPDIAPPAYLQEKPVVNLSAVVDDGLAKRALAAIDILHEWPQTPKGSLDNTQWAALRRILTQRLAIIQGPPGTGKTFVSKVALEVLVQNRAEDDPPIIIAAQTNHALDQLLGHVSKFDPNYIRLGGRSTNPDVKSRALFEVRQKERIPVIPGNNLGKANQQLKIVAGRIKEILAPLSRTGFEPFSAKVLFQLGIITQAQYKSLEDGAAEWMTTTEDAESSMQVWVNKALLPFQVNYKQDNFGFEEEEEDKDMEFEQLREQEAENGVADEEDIEMLKGQWCRLEDHFTVQQPHPTILDKAKRQLDTLDDLWKVPEYLRGPMYSVMQAKVKTAILVKFREAAEAYETITKDLKVAKWERDSVLLKRANIIGLTTTGLSKYRPLIASLKPKIILIEEAAEVIEAPIAVACVESLEHLILVGDHKQLQGHCSIRELEGEPYYLNVSLFERLVSNNMPFNTLLRQRRMDPEFRRLLTPIYPELEDHLDVVQRQPLRYGMGDRKSFFFDHEWAEDRDSQQSTFNDKEALFVANFYKYLLQNGLSPQEITILTFYNGQRKRILKYLREDSKTRELYNNVKTVDSYQGEENTIILLSLVRSNESSKIGFLEVDNRVCVALSRAKFGFYLFGNAQLLASASQLWSNVIDIMSENPIRIGDTFPIQCQNHGRMTGIMYPEDWNTKTDGGCGERCGGVLSCGHPCSQLCHPYSHDDLLCLRKCDRELSCGHVCAKECSERCFCGCEDFRQLNGRSEGPSNDKDPGSDFRPPSIIENGQGVWGHNATPSAFKGSMDVRGNNTFSRTKSYQHCDERLFNHRHKDQVMVHVPNNGKAQAFATTPSAIRSSSPRGMLPPSYPTHRSHPSESTSTSFASKSTQQSRSPYLPPHSHTSQHSFDEQDRCLKGWSSYAKGGAEKDDKVRLDKSTVRKYTGKEMTWNGTWPPSEQFAVTDGSSPVKNEKVQGLMNGRKIWTQEMKPAGSQTEPVLFGFNDIARIGGASLGRVQGEKRNGVVVDDKEECLIEL